MAQNNITQAYERGFITKCAEYGVAPEALMKQAFTLADAARIGKGVWRGVGVAGKGLASAGRAAARGIRDGYRVAKPYVQEGARATAQAVNRGMDKAVRVGAQAGRRIGNTAKWVGDMAYRGGKTLYERQLGKPSVTHNAFKNLGSWAAGKFPEGSVMRPTLNAVGDLTGRAAAGAQEALGVGALSAGRTARFVGDAANYAGRGIGRALDSMRHASNGNWVRPMAAGAAAGAGAAAARKTGGPGQLVSKARDAWNNRPPYIAPWLPRHQTPVAPPTLQGVQLPIR